jgi:tetratricopeptide (TPR) repeat protein
MGAYTEALASHRRALALREEAAQADPNDFRAARSVASSTARIGTVLRRMGDLDAALVESRRAIVLTEDLAKRSAADWATVEERADAHSDLADTLVALAARRGTPAARQQECRARALAEYQKALALYEDLRDKGVLPKAHERYITELKENVEKVRRAAQ